jgi:NAD(P)-dependent dehydrogenase (short-subunit alcohol dehydrogenase family)
MAGVEGRVALVTGASQGIGRACAIVLAGAGAKVALCARNQEKLEQLAGDELDPENPDALVADEAYATLVTAAVDKAAATSRRILNLDPLNPFSRMQAVWVSFFSRRHDDSIRDVKNLLDLYPNHVWGHFFLAANYGAKRMKTEVGASCEKVMQLLSGAYDMQSIGTCVWSLGMIG